MSSTNFYMGSLRYDHTGRKRKNHAASRVKKKRPTFTPMKIDPIKAKAAQEAADRREAEKQDFLKRLSQMKPDSTAKKERMVYTGTLVKGIATMHKSNAVPVIDDQHIIDIARMRR